MTVYVYKSNTGKTLNVLNYIVTPSPGLQATYQIDVLDSLMGSTISRYDDGVLASADDLIPLNASVFNGVYSVVAGPASYPLVGNSEVLNTNKTVTAADSGKVFQCSTTLTITIPAGLVPSPVFTAIPPAVGTLSIAVSGGAQVNGAAATLPYTRSTAPTGVKIVPYAEANGYGVGSGTGSGGGGGGGASAFADLTDKTSVDIPAINTPLANALAAKAPVLVTTDLSTNYTLTAADNGKAFNVTANITVTAPSGLSPRPEVLFTAPPTGVFTLTPTGGTKLNNATASMTFSRDTNPAGVVMRPYSEYDGYGVSASSGGGSGGSTTFAALTDKTSADLPAINAPLANALASKAVAYPSVLLSGNTTLVRGSHYNRQIVCDTTASNITLTATGSDAVQGDFVSIDVIGGNSVTLAGVTPQSGYTLVAASGSSVEAKCAVGGALIAATRSAAMSGELVVSLVDGDFTANNLNLTSAHTNCILSLAAVTVPVTLTWQTDAIGGYSPTSCKLTVIAGAVAPVAIVAGAGATVAGAVQVIEQGCTGTAWRTGLNTLSPTGSTKPQGSTFGTNATQLGFAATRFLGDNTIQVYGLANVAIVDTSTYSGCGPDGAVEYGHIKRVRLSSAAATANRVAGITIGQVARVQSQNSQFPCIIAGGFSDALTNAPSMLGFTGFTAVASDVATLEPSATIRDMIVIGNDSADTTLSLMHNVNNGTVTKISLGANFPVSQFVAYSLAVWKNNTGTAFLVVATNMNTKATFVKVLTTNLPRTSYGFNPMMVRGSRSEATVSMDFIGVSMGRV